MKTIKNMVARKAVAIATLACMVSTQSAFAVPLVLSQQPLYVGSSITPRVMLTLSKDQQLFKKAYNDYSDLDGDGVIEATYKHSIDYYGYFDPKKCYIYRNSRFEPERVTADKYCGQANEWAGNFLNWVSMSRMDAVRKLLYGGTRSTDGAFTGNPVSVVTVLERAYIPTDAHAWAKYYDGEDIPKLTPFPVASGTPHVKLATTAYAAVTNSFTIPTVNTDVTITFGSSQTSNFAAGDQLRFKNLSGTLLGAVLSLSGDGKTASVRIDPKGYTGTPKANTAWDVTNLSRTGISFCNVTPGLGSITGSALSGDDKSSTNRQPPLIRVALGNYALWNASERVQCQWLEHSSNRQSGFDGVRSNGNQAALSEIYSSAENPNRSGSGNGEYIARVQVCKLGSDGNTDLLEDNCQKYPSTNTYKPVGLLQKFGEPNDIHFGLITGSFQSNVTGGVLRKNIGTITDEINLDDGTFKGNFYRPPGGVRSSSSSAVATGIIGTLDFMRIYGYEYYLSGSQANGDYLNDGCSYQEISFTDGKCASWGNPMSEIYFEAVKHFAGGKPLEYGTTSKDNELGLPIVRAASWTDPMSQAEYCAPMNVVVFNASVSTNERDTPDYFASQGASAIGSSTSVASLTNAVGTAEGITNNSFFVGKTTSTSSSAADFELCSAKTITALGEVTGICPEGPTTAGSYFMAGIAHHAKKNRIRSDLTTPSSDERSLKVTSYGIQLATNVPTLELPVPGSSGKKVIIQPIYRLVNGGYGGGALVDLKFVKFDLAGGTGKIYVNWEDSEQGGDYDQDMWGTLEWKIDAAANTVTITTNAVSMSTSNAQGFGYAISGTTKDGPHFHSGILGFNFTDPKGVLGCTNCQVSSADSGQRGATSVVYTLSSGGTTAGLLKDPLWYLAKYGAFDERKSSAANKNGLPDVDREWDNTLADGLPGQDGVPDNYFLVTNPIGLAAALERAFNNIVTDAQFTSVAANSTSLQTVSHIYQARFHSSDWRGSIEAFKVMPDATVDPKPVWNAGTLLNEKTPDQRTILTFNDTSKKGVAFRWPSNASSPGTSDIPKTLVDSLNRSPAGTKPVDNKGSQRLNWLRGDPALEGDSSTNFRTRAISRLGDIVNSDPAYVGPPNAPIRDADYDSFRSAKRDRPAMVYAGANDGMLHGFDALTGVERLAYVPSKVHGNLSALTNPSYVHQYYVDGTPEIADAKVKGAWKTVLVGGLAAGGQGIYALDVTDPGTFAETKATQIVMWEFTDKDDPHLGNVFGKPTIRQMQNGEWAAIVTGGYNNSDSRSGADTNVSNTGRAYLFIIFLKGPANGTTWQEGSDYIRIATDVGETDTPNGLSDPFPADPIGADGLVDFVYAGDLRGNLWKFDLRSTSTGDWKSSANRLKLFTAKDGAGNAQPITTQPEGTLHPSGKGYVITFGTGKYIEQNDLKSANWKTQSFYGIWDKNDGTVVTNRTQLVQQDIAVESTGTGTYRTLTNRAVDSTKLGWFMDFPVSGERSVFRPLLLNGRLIFTTLAPSVNPCDFGGSSYLMVVSPTTGGRVDAPVLDANGDGTLNASDKIGSGAVYASGVQSKVGILPTPAIVTGGISPGNPSMSGSQIYGTSGPLLEGTSLLIAFAIGGGSNGLATTLLGLAASSGRVTWREVLAR